MKMFSFMTAGSMVMVALVISMVTAEKINGKLDIVVQLVPGQSSGLQATPAAKDACGEFFRDHFDIGNDSVRLAIVDPTSGNWTVEGDILFTEKIRLDLTGDFTRFNEKLKEWFPNYYTTPMNDGTGRLGYVTGCAYHHWLNALDRFVFKVEERHKIVIMVDAWVSNTVEADRQLANTMRREKNIFIYAVVPPPRPGALETAEAFVGKENLHKLILVASETKENFLDGLIKIKDFIAADVCKKKTLCQYNDSSKGECKQERFEVDEMDSVLVTPKCMDVKVPNIACIKNETENKDRCRDTCDIYWPWANPTDCTKICGHASSRLGNKPDVFEAHPSLKAKMKKSLKDHCDHQFNCQPCSPKNPSNEAEKAALEASKQLGAALWIILGVIALVLIVTLLTVVGIIIFIKNRNVHKAEHEMKVKAAMQVVTDISMFISRGGNVAGTEADLQDVEESLAKSTMRLKSMMKPGKPGVHIAKGGSTKPTIKGTSVKNAMGGSTKPMKEVSVKAASVKGVSVKKK